MCESEGSLSQSFLIDRGVKQGSVLSPTLFLLIMNPLLQQLQSAELGLSINNLYVGGFAHADDIRTISASKESLEGQVNLVKRFCEANHLHLNVQKCQVIVFDRQGGTSGGNGIEIEGEVVPWRSEAKCLGYWWKGDLFVTSAVDKGARQGERFSSLVVLVHSMGSLTQCQAGPLLIHA